MTTPPSVTASDLVAFAESPVLAQLDAAIAQFNIFTALRISRQELAHSNMLAIMLDPRHPHGLGTHVLRWLLRQLGSPAADAPEEILCTTRVLREWHHIDLLLLNPHPDLTLAIIIENKIDSTEHSNQLSRYWQTVQRVYPTTQPLGVYLTPYGAVPPASAQKTYIPLSYIQVCAALEQGLPQAAPTARAAIQQYLEMTRRDIVGDSQVEQLCRQLYREHSAAITAIVQFHRQRQDQVAALVQAIMSPYQAAFVPDGSPTYRDTRYLRYVVAAWDRPSMRQSKGWVPSKMLVMLEWVLAPTAVNLVLCLGPGPDMLRQTIFDHVQRHRPPFTTTEPLARFVWIFDTLVVAPDEYAILPLHEIENRLRSGWERFLSDDYPRLDAVMQAVLSQLDAHTTSQPLEETP